MPCVPAGTNSSQLYGLLEGGRSNAANFKAWPEAISGIPRGCIVRNTFLEWLEYDYDDSSCQEDNDDFVVAVACDRSKQSRSKSCPGKAIKVTALETCNQQRDLNVIPSGSLDDEQPHVAKAVSFASGDLSRARTQAFVTGPDEESAAARSAGTLRRGARLPRHQSHATTWVSEDRDAEASRGGAEDTARWNLSWQSQTPSSAGGRSPNSRGKARSQQLGGCQQAIVLRGLPFNVTEADVLDFVEDAGAIKSLAPSRPILLLQNKQGRPSGFAEVHLNKHANFREVQEMLHMQQLGNRYVEALPPRHGGRFGAAASARHGGTKNGNRDTWRRPA